MKGRILIVDDEEAICWALARALEADGYAADTAATAEAGLRLIDKRCPDAMFLDIRMPGMDGLTALERLRRSHPALPVIVMTAFGDLASAVRAIEGGAFDYLTKPFDLDQAMLTATRALNRPAAGIIEPAATDDDELIGRSPAMQAVFKRIALVAPTPSSVLITGASGTGKELVARAIHRHSALSKGPFLPVHIAALNPGLVESELFGHVRGAFTGAGEPRPGLFALADGGTIFLDELADVPPAVQVKLLRVLEQGEVLPVGGDRPVRLKLRVLAATHRDLRQLVEAGSFRHDLYFRLNVFRVHLPDLADRGDDVIELSKHFLRRFAASSPSLPAHTLAALQTRTWPGNVRELRNAVEHAAILARGGSLEPEHFAAEERVEGDSEDVATWVKHRLRGDAAPSELYAEFLRTFEPALFAEVILRTQGNRSTAAEWLGLDRATVRKKLHLYGLADDAPGPNSR